MGSLINKCIQAEINTVEYKSVLMIDSIYYFTFASSVKIKKDNCTFYLCQPAARSLTFAPCPALQ